MPSFYDLGFVDDEVCIFEKIVEAERGLVIISCDLFTDVSATLAALTDLINERRQCYISTIDSPIEYLHRHKKSVVVQKEIGTDVADFGTALQRIKQENPDVVVLSQLQQEDILSVMELAEAAEEDGLSVEIRLPQGTVNLDSAAGVSAANQAGANLQISLNRVNHNQVPAGQRGEIRSGDVVFRIAVASGTNTINEFDGIITITLPFTGTFPAAVWYLDSNGNLHRMESTYNRTARTVTFTTNHLSLFVVGHDDGTRNEVTAGDTDEGITDIPPGGYPNVNYKRFSTCTSASLTSRWNASETKNGGTLKMWKLKATPY